MGRRAALRAATSALALACVRTACYVMRSWRCCVLWGAAVTRSTYKGVHACAPMPFFGCPKGWEHIPTDGRSRSMQHGKPLHSRLPSLECGSCTARGQALCDLRVHTPDIPQAHGSSLSTSTCPCCNTCARRFWSTGMAPQLCETMRL